MPIGKPPGHDGLDKEFYEHFWDDLKFYFINSLKQPKVDGHLSFLKGKQTAKKERDKRFAKIWRPISLLNVETKILSKSLVLKVDV